MNIAVFPTSSMSINFLPNSTTPNNDHNTALVNVYHLLQVKLDEGYAMDPPSHLPLSYPTLKTPIPNIWLGFGKIIWSSGRLHPPLLKSLDKILLTLHGKPYPPFMHPPPKSAFSNWNFCYAPSRKKLYLCLNSCKILKNIAYNFCFNWISLNELAISAQHILNTWAWLHLLGNQNYNSLQANLPR